MSQLGKAIKRQREERSMSLQDVAEEAGLTKAHVWELEQGNSRNPRVKSLLGLAVALNMDPSALAVCAMSDLPGCKAVKMRRVNGQIAGTK